MAGQLRNKQKAFSLFLPFLLQSCVSIKPLEFRQANHFIVNNVLSTPEINFDMVFNNPNSFGCTVKEIKTYASVSNGSLFTYQTDKSFRIKRSSEFAIPIHV